MRTAIYGAAAAIAVLGLSYAAVPLYQIFCQVTGYGGTTQQADAEKFKNMRPVRQGEGGEGEGEGRCYAFATNQAPVPLGLATS
jgi:hypothetical protein